MAFWGGFQEGQTEGRQSFPRGQHFALGMPDMQISKEKFALPPDSPSHCWVLQPGARSTVAIRTQALWIFNIEWRLETLGDSFRPREADWDYQGTQPHILSSYQVFDLSSMRMAIVGLMCPVSHHSKFSFKNSPNTQRQRQERTERPRVCSLHPFVPPSHLSLQLAHNVFLFSLSSTSYCGRDNSTDIPSTRT